MSFFGIFFDQLLAPFWRPKWSPESRRNHILGVFFWMCFHTSLWPPLWSTFAPLLAPKGTILSPFASLFGHFFIIFGAPNRVKKKGTKTRCLLDLGNFGHISQQSMPKPYKNNSITLPATKRPDQKTMGRRCRGALLNNAQNTEISTSGRL